MKSERHDARIAACCSAVGWVGAAAAGVAAAARCAGGGAAAGAAARLGVGGFAVGPAGVGVAVWAGAAMPEGVTAKRQGADNLAALR